jgi:hypothetical protein
MTGKTTFFPGVIVLAMVSMSACASAPQDDAGGPVGSYSGVHNVEAGPIWSQEDATVKCPALATAARGKWTGQWVTTRQGEMSVCEIDFRR